MEGRRVEGESGAGPWGAWVMSENRLDRPPEFSPGHCVPQDVAEAWLRRCGRRVRIFRGCRLIPPEQIEIGDDVQIDEGVRIYAGRGVTLGSNVHLAFASSISGGGECVIHDFAGLGAGVRLITGTEDVDGKGLTNPTVPARTRSVFRGKVEIGAHALILTNAVVFPGVTVGEGTVVAAGSVVHHSLKAWAIYAGKPLVQVGVRPRAEILRLAAELRAAANGVTG
jgi:acetyltransferase-like isoleucine patch superfamily enzyme